MRTHVLAALVLLGGLGPATASAQTADNLLVVVNEKVPASVQVGDYYIRKRAVAQDHVVRIQAPATDEITRAEYNTQIETPIAVWIQRHGLEDKILYLVLTKGVPLRIGGPGGRNGTMASVDSELTLLYRKMVGMPVPLVDRIANPYFLDEKPIAEAKPFTRFSSDIYLVTRLDGFTVADVIGEIDRASAPAKNGRIVLDEKATIPDPGGDRWLAQAADRLRAEGAGDRVLLEMTTAVAATDQPVIGYYSWGSNDRQPTRRRSGFTFVNGAIGGMYVSSDGRTFTEPPADWKPSGPNGGPQFGGTFQSLAGDLIRDGITGVAGHVSEPYLDATIRPNILFPSYLAGMNLAESFYLAMPFLSWQTVIVGDPLCAPFRTKVLTPEEIAKDIDPDTELPALFSARRLAWLGQGGLNPQAVKLILKLEAQTAREDKSHAEDLLTQAVTLEPRLTGAGMQLAGLYEVRAEYDKAIDRYRKIVAVDPTNALALNNLAYDLAERQHNPKDALPLAERAYRAARVPIVADTLGWIHHLLGDDQTAAPLIEEAVAGDPNEFDVQFHAATVHAALGDLERARKELDAALKIDPKATDRADVKVLVDKIKKVPRSEGSRVRGVEEGADARPLQFNLTVASEARSTNPRTLGPWDLRTLGPSAPRTFLTSRANR